MAGTTSHSEPVAPALRGVDLVVEDGEWPAGSAPTLDPDSDFDATLAADSAADSISFPD